MALTLALNQAAWSSTSSSSLSITSVNAAIGTIVAVVVVADNAGTNGASSINAVSDTSSNTYTKKVTVNRDPGAANAGVTLCIFTAPITNALSSETITVTFSPNTKYKTASAYVLTPDTGYAASVKFTDTGTTGSATSFAYTSSSLDSGDVVLGALGLESFNISNAITYDSDTTRGSWEAGYSYGAYDGATIPTMFAYQFLQYKTVTGTGTQTYNISLAGSANDYAMTTIGFTQTLTAPTYTHTAEGGSYSIAEDDAGLQYGRIFTAATTAYATIGTAATLVYVKGIAGDQGDYVISGTTAGLTKGGVPSGQTLTVDSGIYNYNGTDAGFKYTYVVAGTFGSYGIDGQAALVTKGRTLDATTGGTYTISGTAAGFLYGRVFTADPDTYLISGADTTNYLGKAIIATGGSYSISGTAAALTKNQVCLTADSTAYSITGTASFSYILDGTTFKLDPRISFYSNRDGLVYSYPLGVNFLKYVRNRVNTNERNNLRMTTRTAGSGLLSPEGFVRINIVAGTSYTGLYSSTGALNVILSDPDTNNSQMFHPYGPMRVTEAASSDYGMVADDGSVYAEILR